MDKKIMEEIDKFLKSVEGRTEDPNSKNPLTQDEMSKLAKLRISGILDEYMDQCDEDIDAAEKAKSKISTIKITRDIRRVDGREY